ncbi:MAG: hypothetical protein OXI66_19065 [Boseongicola sp.]|nr:hypothetical protein [Boseongicola sp.]
MSTTAALGGAEPREVESRDVSVTVFADRNAAYYGSVFERLQKGELPFWHMNLAGLLIPWVWSAWRGVWLMFWVALALDVVGLVCLMQNFKYGPLLADAHLDPSANAILIERYTRWLGVYNNVGVATLILGHLLIGLQANRWYYRQYSK